MVKIEDAADDGVGVAEGMHEESDKEVDDEGENVGALAGEDQRFFHHDQTVDLKESVLVQQSKHTVGPITTQLFPYLRRAEVQAKLGSSKAHLEL